MDGESLKIIENLNVYEENQFQNKSGSYTETRGGGSLFLHYRINRGVVGWMLDRLTDEYGNIVYSRSKIT